MLFRHNRQQARKGAPDTRHSRTRATLLRTFVVFSFVCAVIASSFGPSDVSAQTTVAAPTFSHPHGFYTGPFNLGITRPSGVNVRYTLNGNTPTPTSGTILGASSTITIDKTTVVRAIAYTSTASSPVVAQTYIFLSGVRTQAPGNVPPAGFGWPNRFAADDFGDDDEPGHSWYPADYEMDPQVLNHSAYTAQFEAAMKAIPSISISMDQNLLWDPNFGVYYNAFAKEGAPNDPYTNPVKNGSWERPMSIEWIDPNNFSNPNLNFSVNGGIRTHGQASRKPHRTPKKSFRVYFRKGYGESSLRFDMFDYADPVNKFDRLVLRNGGNRSYPYFDRDQRREADYIQDEWARRAWIDMGNLGSRGTYAHLYLNGMYWGLYNVAERIDEKFLENYLGGKDSDYSVISADEDVGDIPVADPPDSANYYMDVLNLVNTTDPNPLTDQDYDFIKTRVDLENFADYFIHVHYIGKTDWPHHNWNAYRKMTGSDQRLKFYAWDNDSGFNKYDQDITLWQDVKGDPDAPSRIFERLLSHPEFRHILQDRFYNHVIDPNGTLTPAKCRAIYEELMAIVDLPIIAESARWGDYVRDTYPVTNSTLLLKTFPAYLHTKSLTSDADVDPTGVYTNSQQLSWTQVTQNRLTVYCPKRSDQLKFQYRRNGWYPTDAQALHPPQFSQPGGKVTANYALQITNALSNTNVGDIYYTLDNSDPRLEFGAISPTALNGGDLVNMTIKDVTRIKARVFDNGKWSPLVSYTFYPPQPFENVVISEIHYAPSAAGLPASEDPEDYEFIELYNKGTTPIRLDNAYFSKGISYSFSRNTTIYPGQYLVIAGKKQPFTNRYGFEPFDTSRGKLSNGTAVLELSQAPDSRYYNQPPTVIDSVPYSSVAPWPTGANGGGGSLCLNDVNADNSQHGSWSVSSVANGTPGSGGCTTASPGQARVQFSPNSLNFDEQPIMQPSVPQIITLTNTGSAPLSISSLTSNSSEFSITTCGTSLGISKSCQIQVRFTPNDNGTRNGEITLISNAPGSPHKAALTGIGSSGTRLLTVSPTALIFGQQNVGTTSDSKVVLLSNDGTLPVRNLDISISGDFLQTNVCPATLPPDATCTVSVSFKPNSQGQKTGTLTIASNATAVPYTVALSGGGTGGIAALNLSASSLKFDDQGVNTTSAVKTVTVTNFGTGPATITSIGVSGTNFKQTHNCGNSIAVGASCTVSVSFTPKSAGDLTSVLTIASNALNTPNTVNLSGKGTTSAALSLSVSELVFESQIVNAPAATSKNVTITNNGSAAATISAITVSSSHFRQTNTCGTSLAAGRSCVITVTFAPTQVGEHTGTLTITSNASNSPHRVSLVGKGSEIVQTGSKIYLPLVKK
jgi:hypothetical protein